MEINSSCYLILTISTEAVILSRWCILYPQDRIPAAKNPPSRWKKDPSVATNAPQDDRIGHNARWRLGLNIEVPETLDFDLGDRIVKTWAGYTDSG
jgi:hypothetical protein